MGIKDTDSNNGNETDRTFEATDVDTTGINLITRDMEPIRQAKEIVKRQYPHAAVGLVVIDKITHIKIISSSPITLHVSESMGVPLKVEIVNNISKQ